MCLISPVAYLPRITVEKEREKNNKVAFSGCLDNYTQKNAKTNKKTKTKAFLNLPLVGLSESFEHSRPDEPRVEFLLIGSRGLPWPITKSAGGPRETSIRLVLDESLTYVYQRVFQNKCKIRRGYK